MKCWNKIFTTIAVLLILLLASCVNDDGVLPDGLNEEGEFSLAAITILNKLETDFEFFSENDLCFRFEYPITLNYNTESFITIENFEGLKEAINNQNPNFNINGVVFPFKIILNDGNNSSSTIQNESDFIDVLRSCQIEIFRDEFDATFGSCFKLEYPVTLFNEQNEEKTIGSDEDINTFILSQSQNYQPLFKFPITLKDTPENDFKQINTYYEFYEVLNNCEACVEVFLTSELINSFNLIYKITPNPIDDINSGFYEWFVNDILVTTESDDERFLIYTFEPGTYNVCLKIETPNCSEQISTFCKTIIVEEICPQLAFDFEQVGNTFEYNFTANFEGIDQINYNWIIDEDEIESDGGPNGDNMLNYNFTIGSHQVCIFAETPSCPQGVEFCKDIVIEAICPNLSFTFEEVEPNLYDFTADFDGINETIFGWYVNDVFIQNGGGNNGNVLEYQFTSGAGEQLVCIKAETNNCPNGTDFCEDLFIQ